MKLQIVKAKGGGFMIKDPAKNMIAVIEEGEDEEKNMLRLGQKVAAFVNAYEEQDLSEFDGDDESEEEEEEDGSSTSDAAAFKVLIDAATPLFKGLQNMSGRGRRAKARAARKEKEE